MNELSISGRIVDPLDGVYDATVLIRRGKIATISDKGLEGKNVIQLTSSQLLFPGFIDTHVHMREPGWEYKEDFLSGSKAALHGGVTTVADMPNLPEPITTRDRLVRKMKVAGKSLVDVLHLGGVGHDLFNIKNLAALVPAFKIYTAKSTGELFLDGWGRIEEAVKIISKLEKPVTFHCEEQSIIDKDPSRPREAEIIAVEKVLEICKKYGTKVNIAHISVKEALEIVNENIDQMQLTCEVAPHHVFFNRKDVKDSLMKVNPPLREKKDSEALLKELNKGKCMIATDHAPHTLEEKNSANPPSGMPGLDTYGNFVLWLLVKQKIKPQTISKVTSLNAANYLGIKNKARIKENFAADLVILDKKGKTKIENKNLYTKCGWSAFDGMTFPGKVVCTIRNGVITAKDGIVL